MWAATLSAHAVEGGAYDTDWWRWEQRPGRIADGSTSKAAAGHFERFRDDFALAAKLGIRALLLSVEWGRIEPEDGRFDPAALDHYTRVFETLAGLGVEPLCVLFDGALPAWFAQRGGWLAPDAPAVFARYAAAVADALGDRVRRWIPAAAPMEAASMGYLEGRRPPGRRSLFGAARAVAGLICAQAAAYRAIRDRRADAEVGLWLDARRCVPFDEESAWDLRAARWEHARWNRILPDALAAGRLPFPSRRRFEAGAFDFLAVSWAGLRRIQFRPGRPATLLARRVDARGRAVGLYHEEPDAEALRGALAELAAYGKPMFVVAGWAVEDSRRCALMLDHIEAVRRALDDGLDIRGYLHRSLLDGFEWERGHSARYGLIHVEHGTSARTPNPSAYLYKDICETGALRRGAVARYCPGRRLDEETDTR